MLSRDPHAIADVDPADEAEDEAALAEYEAKGGIRHEAIMAWVASWGTGDELPPPHIED